MLTFLEIVLETKLIHLSARLDTFMKNTNNNEDTKKKNAREKKSYFTISQLVFSQRLFSTDTEDDSFAMHWLLSVWDFLFFILAIFYRFKPSKISYHPIILNKSLFIFRSPLFSFFFTSTFPFNDSNFTFFYTSLDFIFSTKVETITRHFCACVCILLLLLPFYLSGQELCKTQTMELIFPCFCNVFVDLRVSMCVCVVYTNLPIIVHYVCC